MKPCSHNRKLIAWLAVGLLEAGPERELRAHLESCPGCRGYLQEMSNVTGQLNVMPRRSDIETSESFHRRVVGALRAEETPWATAVTQFRAVLSDWRIALPVATAIVALIAAVSIFMQPPKVSAPAPIGAQAQAGLLPHPDNDLNPTLSNYQMMANRSLDSLDELLTRQGNRNPAPTPIYTASTRAGSSALE